MEVLLSKTGRQTSFPISPIVRQTMDTTLGFSESEIKIATEEARVATAAAIKVFLNIIINPYKKLK
jgi:hypothetical protein